MREEFDELKNNYDASDKLIKDFKEQVSASSKAIFSAN
jgi:hypothetical protein